MPILKNKVAHAKRIAQAKELLANNTVPHTSVKSQSSQYRLKLRKKPEGTERRLLIDSSAKGSNNIMKNYSRALVNFASSDLATPYLKRRKEEVDEDGETIPNEEFQGMLNAKKEKINCIKSLRELLLVEHSDTRPIKAFKRTFRYICVIFINYFSVNWIFSSKISDKMGHLKYRFKILRRVRNPEYFTYLETFSKWAKH